MSQKFGFASYLTLAACFGLLSACGYTSPGQAGLIGGIGGGGLGAGIGAIIGDQMTDGDVGESALVGGAIGVPLGVALGVAYNEYKFQEIVENNQAIIENNAADIQSAQLEMDLLRDALIEESYSIHPNDARGEFLYDGPTLGQYRR